MLRFHISVWLNFWPLNIRPQNLSTTPNILLTHHLRLYNSNHTQHQHTFLLHKQIYISSPKPNHLSQQRIGPSPPNLSAKMAENADPSSASRKPQDPASKTPDPTSPPAESSPADLEDGEYEESAPNAPPLPAETAPPLPTEAPPLPSEAPPEEDDGWAPVWDNTAQAFYFYNRFTHATQWTNPRVPEGEDANIATATTLPPPPGLSEASPLDTEAEPPIPPEPTGYNPAIHVRV